MITIWHLLTHTSGLGSGSIDGHPVEKMYHEAGLVGGVPPLQMPLEEVTRRLADLPLISQPGSVWCYSIAYDVIGRLIEIITDKPFDVFLKQRIFDPLGMEDTGFFVPKDKRDRFGPMYSNPQKGEISVLDKGDESPFLNPDIPPSGGRGLVSTMSDYYHFLALLANRGRWCDVQLLSQETVNKMTINQLTGGQFWIPYCHRFVSLYSRQFLFL